MKYSWILISILFFLSCNSKEVNGKDGGTSKKEYTKFNGDYNKTFGDLHDLHSQAASKNGINPLVSRSDVENYEDELVEIDSITKIYKVDPLKYSIPYLVPKASDLLIDICTNFKDSLKSKKLPLYKLIITSITRTDDDVKSLMKRNRNASDSSVHRFATTFDISWRRYEKVDESEKRSLDDERLKAILGQVLHDLRERERCYVKHERKQACFHITVR